VRLVARPGATTGVGPGGADRGERVEPPYRAARHRRGGAAASIGLAAALLAATCLVAASVGKAAIPIDAELAILARRLLAVPIEGTWPESWETILLEIRLPRIALGALVGAALAVAGASFQGLFRNPLADPYLLGVASGAGLGAVLAFVLPFPAVLYGVGIVQGMAFLGAAVAVAVVFALSRVGRTVPTATLILAGVALGSMLSAGTAYLMYRFGDRLVVIYGWLIGGFNVATWGQVRLVAPGVLLSAVVITLGGRMLNVLQLGEESAAALGVPVERVKLALVLAATLATAAAVSAAGLIGFVGLIVPHAVRLLVGPDYRRLVPLSALGGAAFLVAADALARALPGPTELPVGVVTAGCGAPFFLYLLRRQKRAIF
jgi:iron complex transport system permease protein